MDGISSSTITCALNQSRPREDHVEALPRAEGIPSVILEYIVDEIIDGAIPMGIAALQNDWRKANSLCFPELRCMSLVHSTWTHSARRGLRQRVVLSNHCFNNFLFSPFCGPFLTELIIYWNLDPGEHTFRVEHRNLLRKILSRTPNVRSLAFNTVISWETGPELSATGVDACLGLFAKYLPNLENLWLKHFVNGPAVYRQCNNDTCPAVNMLCFRLREFRSLEFLSVRSWIAFWRTYETERPCASLKALDIETPAGTLVDVFTMKGGPSHLESLTLTVRQHDCFFESFLQCKTSLRNLRLVVLDDFQEQIVLLSALSRFVAQCQRLECLDIHAPEWTIMHQRCILPEYAFQLLPKSVERMAFHIARREFRSLFSEKRGGFTSRRQIAVKLFWESIHALVDTLPRLRLLVIAGTPWKSHIGKTETDELPWKWSYLELGTRVHEAKIPKSLLEMCRIRSVKLVFFEEMFPRITAAKWWTGGDLLS